MNDIKPPDFFPSTRKLEDIDFSTIELPISATIRSKLVELKNRKTLDVNEVVRIIELDPALTAIFFKLANNTIRDSNSFCYTSIKDSIQYVIGAEEALDIALSLSEKNEISVTSHLNTSLWIHSFAVGQLAKDIARLVNIRPRLPPEYCFLSGLLHDVGHVVIYSLIKEQYFLAEDMVFTHAPEGLNMELKLYGVCHNIVGAKLAKEWNLPAFIVAVIENHHNDKYDDPHYVSYIAIVRLAESILHMSDTETLSSLSSLSQHDLNCIGLDSYTKLSSALEPINNIVKMYRKYIYN